MDQMHPNSGGVRYDPVGYPGLNDEYGHHWLDIFRCAILMRANKPEIQIGGSV